jgi:hypothetical protein|tara:strand:+ start:906 stop:1133 length:228 start_codon:yes stop_codon:yes gene_type:complete
MKNIDINTMIDQEFEDFENDRKSRKNIKLLLSFNTNSVLNYDEKNIIMTEPKLKKKIGTRIYIKQNKNKNNNQLF